MAGLFDSPERDRADVLIAFVDGGSRGNPGPAGYGVYLADANGRCIGELCEFLGVRTNNVAEYSGLLAALRYATENCYDELRVVSDSELMVKQMLGRYKVNSPDLRPLYDQARALAVKLARFSITHVLRGKNKEADRLANLAMDRGVKEIRAAGPPRANAYAKPPAPPAPTAASVEFEGVVRDGVVEIFGVDLPEGTRVKLRRSR